MKRIIPILLAGMLLFTGCGTSQKPAEPEIARMEAICELSVMDCYYHNVAKLDKPEEEKFLWWSKDAHFWIEYSGVVTMGLDMSQVRFEVEDDVITITLPPAEVQGCYVDPDSLNEDSYIVDKDSADITAELETEAFALAQTELERIASEDTTLLAQARKKAQKLLAEYISTFSTAAGTEYEIVWNLLEPTAAPDSSGE